MALAKPKLLGIFGGPGGRRSRTSWLLFAGCGFFSVDDAFAVTVGFEVVVEVEVEVFAGVVPLVGFQRLQMSCPEFHLEVEGFVVVVAEVELSVDLLLTENCSFFFGVEFLSILLLSLVCFNFEEAEEEEEMLLLFLLVFSSTV